MPHSRPHIRILETVDPNGEMGRVKVVSDGEPIYAYGFAGKRFAMLADSFWDIAEENDFKWADFRLFGFFFKNQSHKDHGRVIIESQRWLAEKLGTKQANISASLKKLSIARVIYSESRTVWYLNPQIVYCGNGKTHGDAIQDMPDGTHIYATPKNNAA